MVVDGETLISLIIAYHEVAKCWIGGELRDLLISKFTCKQQPVILTGHRIATRKPPNRFAEPVAGKDDIVVA